MAIFLGGSVHMGLVKPMGSHFGWSVNSPPSLELILVGIGMFTGGTIWILAHGGVVSTWD